MRNLIHSHAPFRRNRIVCFQHVSVRRNPTRKWQPFAISFAASIKVRWLSYRQLRSSLISLKKIPYDSRSYNSDAWPESAQVFVARETARDAGQLARQMGRGEVRAASVAWAAADELPRAHAERERPERQTEQAQAPPATARGKTAQADPSKAYWQSIGAQPGAARDEDSLRAKVRDALAARQGLKPREEKPEPQLPDGLTDAQRQLRRDLHALDRTGLESIRKCGVFRLRRLTCRSCRRSRARDASARTSTGAYHRASAFGFAAAGGRRVWSIASADAWRSAC